MRVRSLLPIGLVLLAVIGLGFEWLQASRAREAADARTQAELRALREEVAALQAEPRPQPAAAAPVVTPELIARVKAAVVQQQGPAAQALAQAPAAELTPEQEREDLLRYGRLLEDRLTRAVRAQDGAAAELKGKVEAALGAGSLLLDTQCSAELCRIKTRHENLETYRAFQGRAFQDFEHRIWNGPVTFIILEEPDDHGRPLLAAIYMGRGDRLPSPEPAR